MDIGVVLYPTNLSAPLGRVAAEAEARGIESLWFPEHTHIPTSRRTPYPGGEPIPEVFKRTLDPFAAIAHAAASTTRLRFGTAVCLLAQRDPIVTAKAIATVDQLSDGRMLLGLGHGWNIEEMEDHGVDPKRRRSILREKVLAMQALWAHDEASFEGNHVSFSPSWSWPKPVQRPGVPVIMGASAGPRTFADMAEFCDGWMPIHGRGDILASLPDLRTALEDAGREPDSMHLGVIGVPPRKEELARYAEVGFRRVVFALDKLQVESGALRMLDEAAAFVDAI